MTECAPSVGYYAVDLVVLSGEVDNAHADLIADVDRVYVMMLNG